MIKYYAYYNYGGYKDLYLGSSDDTVECRYFLPMLSVYMTDPLMREKVEVWKNLPAIISLSNQTEEYSYPSEARVMMSHAGYKLQYRLIGNYDVCSLRDIAGGKDTYGRSCPFVMMLVADTLEDKELLKILTHYIWCNTQEAENMLCTLFVNDFDVNGLRFDVKNLNDFVVRVASTHRESIEDNQYKRKVPFFIVSDGFSLRNAFEEQQISEKDVAFAYDEGKLCKYRYAPSQVQHEPSGAAPVISPQYQKGTIAEKLHETNTSVRSALGLAKDEDLQILLKSQEKLIEKIERLEKRIIELEKKVL